MDSMPKHLSTSFLIISVDLFGTLSKGPQRLPSISSIMESLLKGIKGSSTIAPCSLEKESFGKALSTGRLKPDADADRSDEIFDVLQAKIGSTKVTKHYQLGLRGDWQEPLRDCLYETRGEMAASIPAIPSKIFSKAKTNTISIGCRKYLVRSHSNLRAGVNEDSIVGCRALWGSKPSG